MSDYELYMADVIKKEQKIEELEREEEENE